jgi:hypothetical protein
VQRADVRLALDELVAGVWYLTPLRDGLARIAPGCTEGDL